MARRCQMNMVLLLVILEIILLVTMPSGGLAARRMLPGNGKSSPVFGGYPGTNPGDGGSYCCP